MKRILVPALAFTVVAAGAACGSDASADPPPPPTTTSPTASDEEALRDLAEGWNQASKRIYFGEAGIELAADYLLDPYLAGFQAQASEFLSSGQTPRRSDQTSQDVETVRLEGGTTAIVIECVVDADAILDSSGAVVNDDVVAKRYRSEARDTPDGWRYTDRETVSETDGATTCPAG